MARQGKGMDLFHSGVTLIKSTVEGRAALMAENWAVMIHALVIHDHALRSLLPKYCGYEVCSVSGNFSTRRNRVDHTELLMQGFGAHREG